ncbi:MAG: hypothetical protein U0802_16925 [Candidatus Binatia bacterium]
MRCPEARAAIALFAAALLCSCAAQQPDSARLEAAIARFERAAAQAEAAAAQAEASARQAEAAAQAQQYRRCAEAGRGPVRDAAQARRLARSFLGCLALAWGKPSATARIPRTPQREAHYRVDFGTARAVLVAIASGRADLAPSAPSPSE